MFENENINNETIDESVNDETTMSGVEVFIDIVIAIILSIGLVTIFSMNEELEAKNRIIANNEAQIEMLEDMNTYYENDIERIKEESYNAGYLAGVMESETSGFFGIFD